MLRVIFRLRVPLASEAPIAYKNLHIQLSAHTTMGHVVTSSPLIFLSLSLQSRKVSKTKLEEVLHLMLGEGEVAVTIGGKGGIGKARIRITPAREVKWQIGSVTLVPA